MGLPDSNPDQLLTSMDPDAAADPDPAPSLSHKSVERTEIINFLAKNLILIIKHIFTILKLFNFLLI